MVMTTTEMVLRVAGERAVTPTPLTSQSTSRSEKLSAAKALVNKLPTGLMIQSVDIDSDLYNSGLKQGDIITEINGTTITTADIALDIIDDSSAGDSMTLKVYVASTGKYKKLTAKMLEDKSVSSYSTQEQQTTTSSLPIW